MQDFLHPLQDSGIAETLEFSFFKGRGFRCRGLGFEGVRFVGFRVTESF